MFRVTSLFLNSTLRYGVCSFVRKRAVRFTATVLLKTSLSTVPLFVKNPGAFTLLYCLKSALLCNVLASFLKWQLFFWKIFFGNRYSTVYDSSLHSVNRIPPEGAVHVAEGLKANNNLRTLKVSTKFLKFL